MPNSIKYIRKAQQMELIKNQIQLSLTKGELNQLIAEGLADPDIEAAIKKALTPLLADKFTQFPDFTNISLGETDEAGATLVTLKQPPASKPKGPIKSIEPQVIDEPEVADEEPEEESQPEVESDVAIGTNAYIDPASE